ncbi:MAG: hypothetical protein AVDCRST_MAG43-471 [uncultured Thermomicrobiales bacterium]|uniref:Heparinase II/III-like C-terminal domain-containing protein n=1 Tax=uncultured Thermomicrobiales bacterium TaxID=1645740 RepID=A0A6J4U9P4_9BACT|nr:MAG: hypothetical protein AVDCRST_MAG43-471 [uncultured Thermomicrobiales bacterium]
MTLHDSSPFDRTASELERLLHRDRPVFPEFEHVHRHLDTMRNEPYVQAMLAEADTLLANADMIPQTTYSRHQAFALRGEREPYQAPYFLKRHTLNALVLRFILGRRELKDAIHDYLWDICEETTWVVPAHARVIDLMAAETALALVEILALLGEELDPEVRRRVQREIDDRIFTPFFQGHFDLRWFNGSDNWNGVCSGAIGGAFLYLEHDSRRLAHALTLILESLETYLATAFEEDGGSTEGVGYWQYGLNNVVVFAEMLRSRTGGQIDLLSVPRMRQIATFPAKMLLPNDRFVSFSDCPADVAINPGIIARLAERTGEPSLLNLLSPGSTLDHQAGGPRGLRNLAWWDGRRHEAEPVADTVLPATGIARLTEATTGGEPIVLIVKAGHNDENHNHNDVGSFVLNVAGEDFLTDPGPGRVDRDYFSARKRYANIFANSGGHGVPRVGGQLQGTGRVYAGSIHGVGPDGAHGRKAMAVTFAQAYPVPALEHAQRRFSMDQKTSIIWLEDTFRFADAGCDLEDVFVTWLPVTVDGTTALIQGLHHHLRVSIEDPAGVEFELEPLEEESRANDKADVLQRLCVRIPGAPAIHVRLRLEIVPVGPALRKTAD